MAKKVTAYIKLQVPAGQANPSPPVGPALGQHGVNIMEFCKGFNAQTQSIEQGAPVPVVIPEEEYSIPGGAGNVAMNLSSLGASVTCLGVVGDDIWGKKLLSILEKEGIKTNGIKIVDNHPTTLKKRIYSNGKQVARIDKERVVDFKSDFLSKNRGVESLTK